MQAIIVLQNHHIIREDVGDIQKALLERPPTYGK